MGRFSRWSSSSQAFLVLAVLFGVGAVIDAALGHTTTAIVSAVFAAVMAQRAWPRRS